jgi:uncharacterized membrane protein YecN with MAPEG domain
MQQKRHRSNPKETPMGPAITGLYAVPLTLIMIALSTHVTMLRAKTRVALGDGGNPDLALRMRRHGNFVENVPIVLLLMVMAELLGAGSLWLHAAGAILLAGRIIHAVGLSGTNSASAGRIIGGSATTIATLIAVGNILAILLAR